MTPTERRLLRRVGWAWGTLGVGWLVTVLAFSYQLSQVEERMSELEYHLVLTTHLTLQELLKRPLPPLPPPEHRKWTRPFLAPRR